MVQTAPTLSLNTAKQWILTFAEYGDGTGNMATLTRTLQATLVPLTSHKEASLQDTVETYRQALEKAFQADCGTKTAVNDVVTPYDLSSYAKDALKNYVPDLVDEADELAVSRR